MVRYTQTSTENSTTKLYPHHRSLGAAIATDLCAANVPLAGIIQIGPVPYVGGTYASNILPIRYEPHHDLVRGLLSGDGE
jgi:uncharacterized membrane protein